MPARYYKIFSWDDPVGEGASQSRYVNVTGVAKRDLDPEPRIVANEILSARLGRALFLPVPPGFLVENEGPWFVSLNFNISGTKLPPVDPAKLVEAHPALASGILLFDAWILNPDRHDRNLAHDHDTGAVGVFDHSRAIAPLDVDLAEYLEARENQLGIQGHCLAPHVTSWIGIEDWAARIKAIPEFFVRSAVGEAVEVGLTSSEGELLLEFLLKRRSKLKELVRENLKQLPSLELSLLTEQDDDEQGNRGEPDSDQMQGGDGLGVPDSDEEGPEAVDNVAPVDPEGNLGDSGDEEALER